MTACKPDVQTPPVVFADINSPQSFGWNSIQNIVVNITVSEGNNGQVMDMLDLDGRRIDRVLIIEDKARFNVRLSSVTQQVLVKSPVTGQQITLPIYNSAEFMALNANAAEIWANAVDTDGDSIPDLWDDFPNDDQLAFELRQPHTGEHYVLFDDGWPLRGDNDFNDVVLRSVMKLRYNADRLLQNGLIDLQIQAFGTQTQPGLGLELFSAIAGSSFTYPVGHAAVFEGVPLDDSSLNTRVLYPDMRQALQPFYTNDGRGPSAVPQGMQIRFSWNPALGGNFVWPNYFLFDVADRSREIHVFGYPPTRRQNLELLGTENDASVQRWVWEGNFALPNAFYRSYRNLPWGMEFFETAFNPVRDSIDFAVAYPAVVTWAESAGETNVSWRLFPVFSLLHQVPN